MQPYELNNKIDRLAKEVEAIKQDIYRLKEEVKKFNANWVKLKNQTENTLLKTGIEI